MRKWKLLFSVAVCMSGSVLAADVPGSHRFGVQFFTGPADVKDTESNEKRSASDLIGIDAFYRRHWSSRYGMEVGFSHATMGIGGALSSIVSPLQDVQLSSIRLSAYSGYALTRGNQVYGKLGITQNRLTLEYKNRSGDKAETGAALAAGWQYQFHSGMAVHSELSYNRSRHLAYRGIHFGLSYRF